MILTPKELSELTGKKRKPSQLEVLRFIGIDHKVRPDGTIIVLKAVAEKALGLGGSTKKPAKEAAPIFD